VGERQGLGFAIDLINKAIPVAKRYSLVACQTIGSRVTLLMTYMHSRRLGKVVLSGLSASLPRPPGADYIDTIVKAFVDWDIGFVLTLKSVLV
jgi:hypothetical protein